MEGFCLNTFEKKEKEKDLMFVTHKEKPLHICRKFTLITPL